jgi:sugar (pentulose or hexulose) kinase
MNLLGIDIGTTHCKVGLFGADGTMLALARRATVARRTPAGHSYLEPERLWQTVRAAIAEVVRGQVQAPAQGDLAAVGVASMAESGLLVDRETGSPRSHLIPWYDRRSQEEFLRIQRAADPLERFRTTGSRLTFKNPLARLLWLRDQDPGILQDAVWLSAADFIAYRLTGLMATDYSLAGRTGAFVLREKTWDEAWLRRWGLSPDIFPAVLPAGTPVGMAAGGDAAGLGLRPTVPVAIAGHDHVCGAFAAGAVEPGMVFDSMGTAETLVGAVPERRLSKEEFASGLAYGCHVVPGLFYWMGNLSTSGGSVEWLRAQLGGERLSYDELETLLTGLPARPTGILYFPYLLGSGSPQPDEAARAAFVGLAASHTRAHLLRAVLEGTAYEMESIRQAAEHATGLAIPRIIAAGGGTNSIGWLQIKADVSGCRIDVLPVVEATLQGAALLAGTGAGLYESPAQALAAAARSDLRSMQPDAANHEVYLKLYRHGYRALQEPLRQYYQNLSTEVSI